MSFSSFPFCLQKNLIGFPLENCLMNDIWTGMLISFLFRVMTALWLTLTTIDKVAELIAAYIYCETLRDLMTDLCIVFANH